MTDDPAARIGALEEILTEKGIIDEKTVESIISYFETQVGPMVGARVVARAWVDPAFRERLLADGTRAIAELGIGGLEAAHVVAVENTPRVHNVVVCTLCSCYPWAVLGLPPGWYKSPEYRSRIVREPRKVLAEMGLTLAPEVEIKVWDSSADIRYLVVPERPHGTEALDEEALAGLVTRDAMIGVGVPSAGRGTPRDREVTAELDRDGPAAPPRRNGELVFAAPWERQLFGVTMALHERGVFAWDDFRAHLVEEIARWTAGAAAGDAYPYYQHWERALWRVLDERGVIDLAAVEARAGELAALPPGHDHDDHHHHDHHHGEHRR